MQCHPCGGGGDEEGECGEGLGEVVLNSLRRRKRRQKRQKAFDPSLLAVHHRELKETSSWKMLVNTSIKFNCHSHLFLNKKCIKLVKVHYYRHEHAHARTNTSKHTHILINTRRYERTHMTSQWFTILLQENIIIVVNSRINHQFKFFIVHILSHCQFMSVTVE